jgi:DNA-binding transcriptional LysR family regulator
MELRQLRYFVVLAEELHFRRAAERRHVTQPAVSQHLRKLEEDLGVQLLEPAQHRVTLTPAGEALLVDARIVLQEADRARRAVIDADGAVESTVAHALDELSHLRCRPHQSPQRRQHRHVRVPPASASRVSTGS